MAKKQVRRASSAPSKADRGGFGFPAGATVTLTDVRYVNAEEMGEKALSKGRQADDPVLKVEGDVDGVDDPITEYFGCGKSERLVASDDGAGLDIPEGSTASGLSESCNAWHFLDSLSDKDKHGKKTVDESVYEDDVRNLIGLKFVVGKKVVKRDFEDDEKRGKDRPVTVAEEIISGPTGPGKGKAKPKRASDEDADEEAPRRKRPAATEDEDEAPAPKRGKKPAPKDEDEDEDADEGDVEEELEKVIVELLGSPKHRKGIDPDETFNHVFTATKTHPQKKDIMAFAEEEAAFGKWLTNRKRPWSVDDDGLLQAVE